MKCNSSCPNYDCGVITIYKQNVLVNPDSRDNPYKFYFSWHGIMFNNRDLFGYYSTIEEEILTTD